MALPWQPYAVDPALMDEIPRSYITAPTCLTLAEAAAPPRVSADGRTYEFRVSANFTRFTTGERVTARSFEFAVERVADPRFGSPAYRGSRGRWRLRDLQRVDTRRDDRLVVALRRPAHDLLARLAGPPFCAVARSVASEPKYEAPVPAAGPYYVASWDPAGEVAVLRRNPYYRGPRPRGPSVIRFETAGEHAIEWVRAGRLDWFAAHPTLNRALVRAERRRRSRTLAVRFLAFDMRPDRPFASLQLRRAVALALDRAELASITSPPHADEPSGVTYRFGQPTDHMLAVPMPGRRAARMFPLRPDDGALARARRLVAAQQTRTVELGVADRLPLGTTQLAMIEQQLDRIGLDVRILAFPPVSGCRPAGEHAGFDLTLVEWRPEYRDPAALFTYLRDPPHGCDTDLRPLLASPWLNRFRAANGRSGADRRRALGRDEVRLLRDHIPVTALHEVDVVDVFSARLGCTTQARRIHRVEAGALCLRRR